MHFGDHGIRRHLSRAPTFPASNANDELDNDSKVFAPSLPPAPKAEPKWDIRYTLDELTVDTSKLKLGKTNEVTFQFVKHGGPGLE